MCFVFIILKLLCVCVHMCVCLYVCVYEYRCGWVRVKIDGVGFLPPSRFHESNLAHQTCWHIHLPIEPSFWPNLLWNYLFHSSM